MEEDSGNGSGLHNISSNSLLNSSFSRWFGRCSDEDSIQYPLKDENALINKCPNETWIECMRFLNRDNLQAMQLVSNKFDLMVNKYFGIYPLRRVKRCQVRTLRNGKLQIKLIVLTRMNEPGKAIETNSDLLFWLQHCIVDCIEFINFQFTDELFYDFHMVDPRLIHLNYCVIDYTRLTIQVNEGQVRRLYQIPAFNNCIGAVFSFSKAFRPFFFAIDTILSLPQKSFVIDFSGYKPTNEDCSIISRWLNQQTPAEAHASRALSLQRFDFTFDSMFTFVNMLQVEFMSSTHKQHFVLTINWSDDDWDLEWQLEDLARTVTNTVTKERLIVKTNGRLHIVREEIKNNQR